MQAARAAGTRVVLDIDYRPVLWNLTSPGLGEQRYVACEQVSRQLQDVLPLCDLVVGTEEEVRIAGGNDEGLAALRRIREVTSALIVMKRGVLGCTAFPGEIPVSVDDGLHGAGFPVEVFNVLGAGDAFMAGLLRGWVRQEPLAEALRYANACGAIVVSRHGCAPAMPSWEELSRFLAHGSTHRRLRDDTELEQLHRVTTRARAWSKLAVLAFDHRSQLEDLADRHEVPRSRIDVFKALVATAAREGYEAAKSSALQDGRGGGIPAAGVIIDGTYGSDVLPGFTGTGWWVGRPVEVPGSRPLAFEGGCNVGLALRTWPGEQVVKCLLSHHPDDEKALARQQLGSLLDLAQACRDTGHELLLEVIPPQDMKLEDDTLSRAVSQIYEAGVRPDWWKLPPPNVRGWQELSKVIGENDPHCRGVLLLGLKASEQVLADGFRAAADQPLCCGFAVGRSLFADAAAAWFAGTLDDDGVIEEVSGRYLRLIRLWQRGGNT
jgi:5-dehydro-2-deoxygluconokinase